MKKVQQTKTKKEIKKPKEEIETCENCDEPDFEGYHKAWCYNETI